MEITKANRVRTILKLNQEGHRLPLSMSTRKLKDYLESVQDAPQPKAEAGADRIFRLAEQLGLMDPQRDADDVKKFDRQLALMWSKYLQGFHRRDLRAADKPTQLLGARFLDGRTNVLHLELPAFASDVDSSLLVRRVRIEDTGRVLVTTATAGTRNSGNGYWNLKMERAIRGFLSQGS